MAEVKRGAAAKAEAAPTREVLCPDCAGFGHFRPARKGGKATSCKTCSGTGMVAKAVRAPRATRSSSSRGAKKRVRKTTSKTPAKA
jgi:DnaJ-class molecular chaperone